MKVPEWQQKLGGTPEAARIAAVLREIEICTDPAHFHSDVLGNPEWDRYVEKLRKEMPPKKTELEAALDTYRKMEIGLGLRNDDDPEKKPRRARTRPTASRRSRKPVEPRSPRRNRAPTRVHPADPVPPDDNVHAVHNVHDVHDVHVIHALPEAQPASAPSPQTAPAPDAASSQSPDSPNPSITPPLQPPTESSRIVPNRA